MTAYSEGGSVRLPPDSTGKKSAAAGRLVIDYQGEVDPNLFEKFQTVTGGSSGATGRIVGKYTRGFTAGEGQLFIEVDGLTGTFQASEDLNVGVTTYATVKATADLETFYYQKGPIVDRDTPSNSLKVDPRGDAYTRFDEGSPALSTFGSLLTESPETIRQHVYAYDEHADRFYDVNTGGASLAYATGERAVILDTNGTSSGVLSQRTSHYYHPYQPGTMMKVMQTVVVGDAGKANVRRRWGLFDDDNGIFWELDGTTMYVVIRSNTSGSPVDTRVAQTDWNRDELDGTNDFNLDLTKANLYWMDLQWLGVGVVRFGIYEEDGTKTTCHVVENPNNETTAYMRQGTLPIRLECENTGAAASSSELKSICTVVKNAGKTKRQLQSHTTYCTGVSCTFSDGEKPILSIRPKTTFNTLKNSAIVYFEEMHLCSEGSGPFLIRVRDNSTLLGDSFNEIDSTSHTEVDCDATGVSGGVVRYSAMVGAGSEYAHDFLKNKAEFSDEITSLLDADGTTQRNISITAQGLTPSASGTFYSSLNIKEMDY